MVETRAFVEYLPGIRHSRVSWVLSLVGQHGSSLEKTGRRRETKSNWTQTGVFSKDWDPQHVVVVLSGFLFQPKHGTRQKKEAPKLPRPQPDLMVAPQGSPFRYADLDINPRLANVLKVWVVWSAKKTRTTLMQFKRTKGSRPSPLVWICVTMGGVTKWWVCYWCPFKLT